MAAEKAGPVPTIHKAAASDELPDRHHVTIPGITYCRYPYNAKGRSSIVTTRFQLGETDALLAAKRQLVVYDTASRPAEEGKEEDAQLLKERE